MFMNKTFSALAEQFQSLKELNSWLDSFRRMWEERFDRLDDYLQQMLEKEKKKQFELED